MTYYIVYVFQMANLTRNTNLISSGVQYALFIIFTTVIFFINKTGRRPLLIYRAIGMGISVRRRRRDGHLRHYRPRRYRQPP